MHVVSEQLRALVEAGWALQQRRTKERQLLDGGRARMKELEVAMVELAGRASSMQVGSNVLNQATEEQRLLAVELQVRLRGGGGLQYIYVTA